MGETEELLRLKLRVLANSVRSVRREPPLKTVVILVFVVFWGGGGFYLFHEALTFLKGFPGIGDYLIGRLFYLFALAVFLMLVFSSALLAYSVLFQRNENRLLFSLPLPISSIVSCKLWESVFLSSWTFVIMVVPLLLAYFVAGGFKISLFFLAWIYFVPFAVICGAIGLVIALVIGGLMPRLSGRKTAVIAVALCATVAVALWRRGGGSSGADQSLRFVNQLMARCDFAAWFLLPSRWVVDGIFNLERGSYGRALFLWTVLLSNTLFFFSLCGIVGEKLLIRGWECGSAGARVRPARESLSWMASRGPVGSIVAKDLVTFIRDPGQWGQFALFFGLLGVYILNLRNLPYELEDAFWKYLLFILNLSALGFTLAGLSSRFFFPLISLELKQFWLLGLSLVSGKQLLREKYFLCVCFTVGITILLTLLSGLMIRVSFPLLVSSVVTVSCMGVAISAISVGLGAVYPNPGARSAAEAISGLGGTMVLVINLIYIFLALIIQGIPLILHLRGKVSDSALPVYLAGSACVLAAVSVGTAVLALGSGRRSLERIEL